MSGFATVRPEMMGHIYEIPPTWFEVIWGFARSVMTYACIALLIFGGSYTATKNPEAFARGFVSGFVGYLLVGGAR